MQQQARDFYQLMSKRRSVRDFSIKPVPASVLEACHFGGGHCAQRRQYAALALCAVVQDAGD